MYISHQGLKSMQDEHISRHLRWADEQHMIRLAAAEHRRSGAPRRHLARHAVLALRTIVHTVLSSATRA